jgi:hypothetical protein
MGGIRIVASLNRARRSLASATQETAEDEDENDDEEDWEITLNSTELFPYRQLTTETDNSPRN